jgi:hypothetical protein
MDDATSTVDEVLRCLELFEIGDDQELKTQIADAPESGPGKIYISTNEGKRTIIVPEGMMADVVRPMYLDTVTVTGRRHVGRIIELQHISLAE